jgi:hypothetical protein
MRARSSAATARRPGAWQKLSTARCASSNLPCSTRSSVGAGSNRTRHHWHLSVAHRAVRPRLRGRARGGAFLAHREGEARDITPRRIDFVRTSAKSESAAAGSPAPQRSIEERCQIRTWVSPHPLIGLQNPAIESTASRIRSLRSASAKSFIVTRRRVHWWNPDRALRRAA